MNPISANPVYDISLSYQKTAAMNAAIKLDIFTTIGEHRLSADQIAEAAGCSSRGVRILCDFLCVIGLLAKDTNLYNLSDDAKRFLVRSSPYCLADIVDFFAAPETVSLVMNDPRSYVKTGGASGLTNVSSDNPVWVKYAQAMVPFASVEAKRTASYISKRAMHPRNVLDVAAGHGLFGIEVAKPRGDAIVTAIDWANVLDVAKKNADAAGLDNRYKTISGNAFEVDWGNNYDLILLPNILHHFDPDGCIFLLGKARQSLCANGSVFVIDIMPNPDRVAPSEQAAFAFFMLATTPHGDAYTGSEYEQMAKTAGLSLVNSMRLVPTPQTLLEFKS
ncbi:MAG: class I SAM-dependent methyltransferase [Smithella sp.]|jgi:2-polyprenyl-3-methyl-5-hydroxy-6-metoxy-1,4-benzoquinol methylase